MIILRTCIVIIAIFLFSAKAYSTHFLTEAQINSMTVAQANDYLVAANSGDYASQKILYEYNIRKRNDFGLIFYFYKQMVKNSDFASDPNRGYYSEEMSVYAIANNKLKGYDDTSGPIIEELITHSFQYKYPKSSLALAKYYISQGNSELAEMHLFIASGAMDYLSMKKLNTNHTDNDAVISEYESLLNDKFGWFRSGSKGRSYFKSIRKIGDKTFYDDVMITVLEKDTEVFAAVFKKYNEANCVSGMNTLLEFKLAPRRFKWVAAT